ncbi:MAG: hypothetical protein LBU65_16940 [Planctomycetaceae bacterium]|jgi:hypothetical protein|nr:hypothetical protein [Planctomycetaceae bacterium]
MTKTIKIGFYGNTAAGKTSFLYRMVSLLRTKDKSKFAFVDSATHAWYEEITQKLNGKTAVTREEFAQQHAKTLSLLEKFGTPDLVTKVREAIYNAWKKTIEKGVSQEDRNISTSVEDDIVFKVQNDIFHPERKSGLLLFSKLSQSDQIKFCFHDVVGEKTRDLWTKAKVSGSPEEKEAKKIISKCDYFVFVLDPTQSNNKPTPKDRERLNDEVKLVGAIADVMPKARGNNQCDIVPILFVLTHRDLKIVTDKEAGEWFDKAHESLRTRYGNVYTDSNGKPVFDNSVHSREKNCFYLSTTDEDASESERILAVLKRIGEIEGLRGGCEPPIDWRLLLKRLKETRHWVVERLKNFIAQVLGLERK